LYHEIIRVIRHLTFAIPSKHKPQKKFKKRKKEKPHQFQNPKSPSPQSITSKNIKKIVKYVFNPSKYLNSILLPIKI